MGSRRRFFLFAVATISGFLWGVACGSDDDGSDASAGAGASAGASASGGQGGSGASAHHGGNSGEGAGGESTGGSGGSNVGGSGAEGGTGGTHPGGTCEPNITKSCNCTEGVGAQRCAPDGTGWSACECAVYGVELAVSPNGSDTASGTPQEPFATLGRAKQEVTKIVANGLPSGGVVVWIHGGDYELKEPLTLGATESGSEKAPVVWRGVPGESARILGGVKVQPGAFSPIPSSSPVVARLDSDARDHVRQLDLSSQGISDFGELERRGFCRQASRSAVELFVNGVRLPLARWPDATANTLPPGLETADALDIFGSPTPDVTGHYTRIGNQDGVSSFARDGLVNGLQFHLYRHTWDYQGSTHTAWFLTTGSSGYPTNNEPWWYKYADELGAMSPATGAGASGIVTTRDPQGINHGFASIAEALSKTQWRYSGDRPSRWTDVSDLRFHGFWKYAWADCHVKAASIDTSTRTITLGEDTGYGIEEGQPWYVYNVPEELTEPGEWWLDRSTGLLYVWPPAGFDTADVLLSTLADAIVNIKDGSWIELRDLRIEAGRAELVKLTEGTHVSLVGLTLHHAGTNAVVMSGTNHRVDHCYIANPGSGGVRVSGGDRPTLLEAGNVVEHSRVEKYGQWEWTYRPAVDLQGVGHIVRHNLMRDAPHSAILYSGNEHTIELNEIHGVCEYSSDAGAIYAGRDWGARGNIIRHNFLHDIRTHFEGYGVHGVYLDDCLSGIRVEGNVFYKVSGMAIQHGGGRDNILVNNVIARCGLGLGADKRAVDLLPKGKPNNTPGDSWNLLEKLQKVGYQDEPWASRYPECAAIPNDWNAIINPGAQWLYPEGCVFSRNVGFDNSSWVNAGQGVLEVYKEYANNLEDVDPLFVDEAQLNLDLQPSSPAFDIPGFEPIPFHDIGIKP